LIGRTDIGPVRCPECRQLCSSLGPTIEIPPKRDVAGWNRLRERVARGHVAAVDDEYKKSVRRRHDLEQRIRELEGRPSSPGRDELVKQLRAELVAKA
jgi:hypothetical protein